MRRAIVILGALAMMAGLHLLRTTSGGGTADPLTLAAIGFVVLTSFAVGEAGSRMGLPKVTGYIAAGVLLGPYLLNVLSHRVVTEMSVFNTLALGLIATSAGLELEQKAIRKVGRTLMTIVAATVVALPLTVGGGFVLLHRLWPVLDLSSPAAIGVLALVVSVLGIGTSPAIALAVARDSGARGRLTDLVLGLAVAKDLVVVTVLAVALGISQRLLGSETAGHGHLAEKLATELGLSIVIGAVVGALLIVYTRFVGRELLIAMLVLILSVAELARTFHLELLLVFIAAGFVVRNLSDCEHRLMPALERISLPVYVVFFTTAGAAVDLRGTLVVLPLALGLTAARAAAFWGAARVGTWAGREPDTVRTNAWMALLPQAGVTLGLVLLSAQALPSLAEPLTRLGMALVACNLLVGPVTMSIGLRRAGETAHHHQPAPQTDLQPSGESPDAVSVDEQQTSATVPEPLSNPPAAPLPPVLAGAVEALRRELETVIGAFVAERAAAASESGLAWTRRLLAPADDHVAWLRQARRVAVAGDPLSDWPWPDAVENAAEGLLGAVRAAPSTLSTPFEPELLQRNRDDSLGMRWRRARARWSRPEARVVPFRMIARTAIEPRLAEAMAIAAGSFHRARGRWLALVGSVASQGLDHDEAVSEAAEIAQSWLEEVDRELRRSVMRGLDEVARIAATAGGVVADPTSVGFSAVEPVVRSELERIRGEDPGWRRAVEAAVGSLRAQLDVELFAVLMVGAISERLHPALDDLGLALRREIEQVRDQLAAAAAGVAAETPEGWSEALTLSRAAYPEVRRSRVRGLPHRVRRRTQLNLLLRELGDLVDNAPPSLEIATADRPLSTADRPAACVVTTIDLATRLEDMVVDHLAPGIDGVVQPVTEMAARCDDLLSDITGSAAFAVELACSGPADPDQSPEQLAREAIARALERCESLLNEAEAETVGARQRLDLLLNRATRSLHASVSEETRTPTARVLTSLQRARRWLNTAGEKLLRQVERPLIWARRAAVGVAGSDTLRDRRLRAGIERLDPRGMRTWLADELPPPRRLAVDPVIRRLFALEPLEDRRLLAAHEDTLNDLARTLIPSGERAERCLVHGPPGSGKTSLLRLLGQQLVGVPRLVRLDSLVSSRLDGVVEVLARDLSCAPSPDEVVAALKLRPTAVLIDDLERLLSPDIEGVATLNTLLRIITESPPACGWVVTIGNHGLDLLGELTPVRQAFTRHVDLGGLSWRELGHVVDVRHRLAGFEVTYPGVVLDLRLGSRRARDSEVHFRRLQAMSGGALRSALALHLYGLEASTGSSVVSHRPRSRGIPFLGQLPVPALGVLGLITRFGPAGEDDLAEILAEPAFAVRRTLHLLAAAGLIEARNTATDVVRIPLHLAHAVHAELAALGVLTSRGGQ